MPIVIACPSCQTKLRVPETSLGKKIKCSKCANIFTAEEPEAGAGPEEVQARPPAARKPARVPPAAEDEDEDEDDEDEGRRFRREDDPVATLIPYRNGRALTAYYCGVFSLIPCLGLLLGPFALIFGILGVRFARANPTAKGTGHAIAGIVLGSLTTLGNWGTLLFIIAVGIASNMH